MIRNYFDIFTVKWCARACRERKRKREREKGFLNAEKISKTRIKDKQTKRKKKKKKKIIMERAERWSSTASPPSILRLHSVLPQTLSSCIPSVSTHTLLKNLERTAVYVHVPQLSLNKCSILKKQNDVNTDVSSSYRQQPTASILKNNKNMDQNQTEPNTSNHISNHHHHHHHHHSVPVTYSTLSISQDLSMNKRHGILKKRSSLDESQIIRRRSCSPDVSLAKTNCSEFKPILKHQRRSSLDEMVRRAQSPDLHPTSILKHNVTRDSEREFNNINSPEPQGILKRKSWSNISETNTGLHVNIANFVPKLTVGGTPLVEISEVRPILKKNHSREDSICESVSLEPRPILKKKSSLECEETDEKPKKTILKSSQERNNSFNDYGTSANLLSPKKLSMLRNCLTQSLPVSSRDHFIDNRIDNVARPILKQNYSTRYGRDDENQEENAFIYSRMMMMNGNNSHSNDILFRKRAQSIEHIYTSDGDKEFLSKLRKRRSLESVYFNDTRQDKYGCKFLSKGISELPKDFVSLRCRQCLNDVSTTALKIPDRYVNLITKRKRKNKS